MIIRCCRHFWNGCDHSTEFLLAFCFCFWWIPFYTSTKRDRGGNSRNGLLDSSFMNTSYRFLLFAPSLKLISYVKICRVYSTTLYLIFTFKLWLVNHAPLLSRALVYYATWRRGITEEDATVGYFSVYYRLLTIS